MRVLSSLVVFGALCQGAFAVWVDNFDSYATNSQLHGQGGWAGWEGNPAAGALTSNAQALSAPNSAAIGGNSDLVHEYSGATSGAWTFRTDVFLPTGRTGTTYLILMNTYTPPTFLDGHWSIELAIAANGGVVDDFRSETPRTMTVGAWNEIKIDINLTSNTQNTYINGLLLSTGTWTRTSDSALRIGALDLYAAGTQNVYYDNMSLVPEPASMIVLAGGALVAIVRRRRK